jgi:hypothetical protein
MPDAPTLVIFMGVPFAPIAPPAVREIEDPLMDEVESNIEPVVASSVTALGPPADTVLTYNVPAEAVTSISPL